MPNTKIIFNKNIDIRGTCLKDYLQHSYSFTEAVARLFSIANYNIFSNTTRQYATFEIRGKFRNQVFTVYDRCDDLIHIGGSVGLDVHSLQTELLYLMSLAHQSEKLIDDTDYEINFFSGLKFWQRFFPTFNI